MRVVDRMPGFSQFMLIFAGLCCLYVQLCSGLSDVDIVCATLQMSGATLEARPKTDGLTVKRGMKGKPKPLYFWNSADVNKWLRKHGGLYYELYGDLLSKHDVTGSL